MAAVTQQIQSYLGGVSRQADKEKLPGYVRDVVNTYPDITFGMTKRPGLSWVRELGNASDFNNGFWFLFRWTESESYIGFIKDATLRMYNFTTGASVQFNDGTETSVTANYLIGLRNDFQFIQEEEIGLILNKNVTVAMDETSNAPGTITGEVNTVAELPTIDNVSPGDIYIVRGISGAADDFVLIWDGQTWQETVIPGAYTRFDATTMPYQIVRTNLNRFTFGPIDWEPRKTGIPGEGGGSRRSSFVGYPLKHMFFHKNRLGFLAKDFVVMGQPVDFFNFWRLSSMTTSDADPIDLIASSTQEIRLFSTLGLTQGLLLFSEREQFVMTAGSDGVLTPATASIRSLSRLEMDTIITPALVGNEIMFTSNAPSYTRVFSMSTRGQNENPDFTDIGKIVSEWIPDGLDRLGANSQNSLLFLFGPDESNIYFYRQYSEGQQQILKSWFKWDMAGTVQGMFTEQDQIWIVLNTSNKCHLLKGNINPTPTSATVVSEDGQLIVNPCVDFLSTPSSITYDSSTQLSTITFPFTVFTKTGWSPIAIQITDPDNPAAAGAYWELTPASGNTFTVRANLTTSGLMSNIRVGYTYPYEIELPKLYYRSPDGRADYTASLIIAREKFAMGKTGSVAFEVRPRGSAAFSGVGEVDQSNWYLLDSAPIDDERMFTLPLHQRNDNFDVRISSDSPYPVSLLSMAWEGQYSPRFYRRG